LIGFAGWLQVLRPRVLTVSVHVLELAGDQSGTIAERADIAEVSEQDRRKRLSGAENREA
jgi:hypothetical protein